MVDVRQVIQSDQYGVVDLDGKVLFAPKWFACHRRLNNLVLRNEFSEILNSRKFSWRIMAEMLLDLETSERPEWAELSWVVVDLKAHNVAKVERPVGCLARTLVFRVGDNVIDPGQYLYGWTTSGKAGAHDCSASEEHVYNQSMMKLFGKKFPFRLVSMTPIRGDIKISVPVEATKGSALEQMYRKHF